MSRAWGALGIGVIALAACAEGEPAEAGSARAARAPWEDAQRVAYTTDLAELERLAADELRDLGHEITLSGLFSLRHRYVPFDDSAADEAGAPDPSTHLEIPPSYLVDASAVADVLRRASPCEHHRPYRESSLVVTIDAHGAGSLRAIAAGPRAENAMIMDRDHVADLATIRAIAVGIEDKAWALARQEYEEAGPQAIKLSFRDFDDDEVSHTLVVDVEPPNVLLAHVAEDGTTTILSGERLPD